MKKIICTVTNDLTYDQRMLRICTSLAVAGYEVLLVGRELSGSKPLEVRPFRQRRFRLFFRRGKFFYLEFNFRLFFYLLFARFQILYAVDLDTLLPAFFVSKIRRKTCVYDAHEYFTEVPELAERPVSKKIWEASARLTVPHLRHCITVCESLAVVFFEKYGAKFTVVRNVPFRQKSQLSLPATESPFILLYQGVLNDGRGLEETIGAMGQLADVELWLAGEGDLSEKLRALVKSAGLEHRVKFLGKLPTAQLSELTPQAHLGLNLLKNKGLNYYYSLANKAFDYIQAGLPSLGMKFPEYERLNREHEVFYLLESLDAPSIASAVNLLRADKKRYDRLAANCREAAKIYNWENEAEKLLDFFQKTG
ncbi:MAG: glycosyltransferase [Bacteroidetes bacterium]|nr:glycosyltransferase [Bacteroidota bacterium]